MIRNYIEIQARRVREKNDAFNTNPHFEKDYVVLNGKRAINVNKLDSYRDSQFIKVFLLTALLLLLSILNVFIVFFLNKNLFQDDHHKILFDCIKYFALVVLSVVSAYLICRILMLCCNMELEDAAISKQLEEKNLFLNSGDYQNGAKKSIFDALSIRNNDDVKKANVSFNIINYNIKYEIQCFDVSYNDFISEYNQNIKNIELLCQKSDNLYTQFLNILNKEFVKDSLPDKNKNFLESWNVKLAVEFSSNVNNVNQLEEKIFINHEITLNLNATLRPILHEYTQYTSIFEFLSSELFGITDKNKEDEAQEGNAMKL